MQAPQFSRGKMQVVRFTTDIQNGVIRIPEEYNSFEKRRVDVILKKYDKQMSAKQKLLSLSGRIKWEGDLNEIRKGR